MSKIVAHQRANVYLRTGIPRYALPMRDPDRIERFAEISTDSCLAEPILSQALRESLG